MAKHRSFLLLFAVGLTTLGVLLRLAQNSKVPERFHYDVTALRSWQLTGWREHKRTHVPWEITYQRSPFYYRERYGGELLVLTEEGCLTVFPPTPGQTHFVSVLAPSRSQRSNLESFLEWAAPERDPATHLPKRYLWQRNERLTAELSATYNQPLTPEMTQVKLPQETLKIDLLYSRPDNVSAGTATKNGLTVRAEARQDPTGVVRVNLQYWLGKTPVTPELPLHVETLVPDLYQNQERIRASIRDDRNRIYQILGLQTHRMISQSLVSGVPLNEESYLTPTEKNGAIPPLAKTLTLPLDLSVQFKDPSAAGIKIGLAISAHVVLTVPITPVRIPFTDGKRAPLPILQLEAQQHYPQALQARRQWKPPTAALKLENQEAIASLEDRIHFQDAPPRTGMTVQ